ncbi:MAG: LysR family transcriptional regulator [Pseudomonadales bacterium]|nr:LysR family transcriptional regulator [Pseudomonadales bacterium]
MYTKQLARTDLNLLVALQVLLEERSVTRAAERLYVTQPAMSKTLQRLRELFGDPLFIRSGRALATTPKAEELEKQLPFVMAGISALVAGNKFDPHTYHGEIRLMAAEFIALQVVPALVKALIVEAPNLSLTLVSESESEDRELSNGSLDFVIEIAKTHSDEYHSTPVGSFMPAVWMHNKHPLADKERLTLEEILQYPFVHCYNLLNGPVSAAADSRFDRELGKRGLGRRKALVTNHLMTAMETLRDSDSLMMATMRDLRLAKNDYDIIRKPYPEELDFSRSLSIELVQHVRTVNSPVHQWVKDQIFKIIESLEAYD